MSANPNGIRTPRAELYEQVRRLRDEEGLLWREIGERLGLNFRTVQGAYSDPTGENDRARKRKQYGACVDCGTPVSYSTGGTAERCRLCAATHVREMTKAWILDSFREWANLFGAPPSAADWNPGQCRNHPYLAWKAARYEDTGRPWPPPSSVRNIFGSWNEGLKAAGFTPLTPDQHWIGHEGVALARADDTRQEQAA
jgi:hypothetical protein